MGVPGSANPLLLAAAQDTGYNVAKSLRFNASDSAYLIRTPSSNGTSYTTWTWSMWVKRSALGNQVIFSAGTNTTDYLIVNFQADDSLRFLTGETGPTNQNLVTTAAVFRDLSAWYHIVIQADFGNATQADRIKIYVNGTRQTISGTIAAQNYAGTTFNRSGIAHNIGRQGNGVAYFSGYLAEIHFIDGQALTPSSFAETNATTGQWVPKAFSGSYGTNGFKLDFADNSATTAAALGKDTSGNGNNFTPNNLSVTAGAGNDSLVDTPTSYGTDTGAGGEVRGNYATWNPLALGAAGSITNGNLDLVITPPSTAEGRIGNFYFPSGKWYWEMTVTVVSSEYPHVGLTPRNNLTGVNIDSNGDGYCIRMTGKIDALASTNQTYGTSYASNDIVMFAYDVDAGKLWYGKNGTWQVSGNPATGANPSSSGISTTTSYTFAASGFGSPAAILNGGQRPFAYTAPSGFKALCDTNLPSPQVAKPNTVFDTKLYTGNGSTQTISGLEFSPDLVWIKERATTYWHILTDSVRGAGKTIYTNSTDQENTRGSSITSLNSDGFSLGNDSEGTGVNRSSQSYVAWTWDAGSSTVTNTQGSITSSVRANTSAGCSVVTWTGTGTAGTIGHGLGAVPRLIITKRRNGASSWRVYHANASATPQNGCLFLEGTQAFTTSTIFNNTAPTSTTFGVGTDPDVNTSGGTYVAYCFAPVTGLSAFGSYTGNGNADGPFVYTGHRSRWLMVKRADVVGNWVILDTARGTRNGMGPYVYANTSSQEDSGGSISDLADFLSNGFKLRGSYSDLNVNGGNYVYCAFAESPFQFSRAR